MSLSALTFAYPAILTALALLPVLWFIMRAIPQAPKRQIFPGYFFLRRIKNEDETPSRTPWYILLVRLLALAAIIIAIAEPSLNEPERLDRTGPVLLVVDDGWAAADQWRTRQNTLETIAAELKDSGRPTWLMLTSARAPEQAASAVRGPLSPAQLEALVSTLQPTPYTTDRLVALANFSASYGQLPESADIRWLSDGLVTGQDIQERQFLRRLSQLGTITAYRPLKTTPYLPAVDYQAEKLVATVRRAEASNEAHNGVIGVLARNGRLLQQTEYVIEAEETEASVEIELPLTLRNDIGLVRLQETQSAGAVQLTDASTRRAMVGVVSSSVGVSGTLLDSQFYLQQALGPYALFQTGSINALVKSDATVIVLDDIGRIRENDTTLLENWIKGGGVLIRFAGPVLADASQGDSATIDMPLIPVPLRSGGRAFGGALTWEKPQQLGGFEEESPFAGLTVDPDIEIRRQILARPSPETSERSWAYLEDGTPLVTAAAEGNGLIVLFHVTAAPDWSDLPISGLFVEMLRRITALSVTDTTSTDKGQSYVPQRVLDGFGRLTGVPDDARPIKQEDVRKAGTPEAPPGLYGDPAAPLAINVLSNEQPFYSLNSIGAYDGIMVIAYSGRDIIDLAKWFFLMALVLLLLDTLLILQVNGKLTPGGKEVTAGLALIICVTTIALFDTAHAQNRPPIDEKTASSALSTRFAFVLTGDQETDTLSRAGLQSLSRKLRERTALEPAAPVGLNLASDEITVYPMIYWPVLTTTPVPDENTLNKIEAYMAGGGLIIFDTRDGDKVIGTQLSAEGAALRQILEQLNVPPLEPVPAGHVLRRSFYLLEDLPGRNEEGPVWVQARSATGSINDGVTPIIISGRDWASAWALDDQGRPLRPMGSGGYSDREMAFRSGINMAMVALTGNYKVDQLQAEALLDRIGEE